MTVIKPNKNGNIVLAVGEVELARVRLQRGLEVAAGHYGEESYDLLGRGRGPF